MVRPVSPDADRFRALFDANFVDVWRFARRRSATVDDADDAAAQVFAVAWRRRADLPAGDDARLWLFGVARGVLANQRRGEARLDRLRRRLGSLALASDGDETQVSELDGDLHAALDALSELDRAVVTMLCWDGLTVTEIATVLECTPNAVSSRLHRARRRLVARTRLKDPRAGGQVDVDGATKGAHP